MRHLIMYSVECLFWSKSFPQNILSNENEGKDGEWMVTRDERKWVKKTPNRFEMNESLVARVFRHWLGFFLIFIEDAKLIQKQEKKNQRRMKEEIWSMCRREKDWFLPCSIALRLFRQERVQKHVVWRWFLLLHWFFSFSFLVPFSNEFFLSLSSEVQLIIDRFSHCKSFSRFSSMNKNRSTNHVQTVETSKSLSTSLLVSSSSCFFSFKEKKNN